MQLTFSDSSSKQLLIALSDIDFFIKIKNENIQLDLKWDNSVSKDVLTNKKIDVNCPDITKLGSIVDDLRKSKKKKINIKKITMELE